MCRALGLTKLEFIFLTSPEISRSSTKNHISTMSEGGTKVKADDCAAPLREEIKSAVLKLKEVPPLRTPPMIRPMDPLSEKGSRESQERAAGGCSGVQGIHQWVGKQ